MSDLFRKGKDVISAQDACKKAGVFLLGLALWYAFHFVRDHSPEKFFAERAVRESAGVKEAVGVIHEVDYPLWAGYQQYSSLDNTSTPFEFKVVGDKKTVHVHVDVEERDGVFKVVGLTVDGKSLARANLP